MAGLLALADFAGMDETGVKAKIVEDFGIAPEQLDGCEIVVAYMSEGSWGCDSDAFIVFRKDGVLYEAHGAHCSCYGFEDQWEPEPVETVEAILKRADYCLAGGGYDSDQAANAAAIRAHLATGGHR